MKLLNLLILLSLLSFYACSKSKESSDASDDPAGVEVVDSDDEGYEDDEDYEDDEEEDDEDLADDEDSEDDEDWDDEEGDDEEVVDSEEGLEDEEIDDAELAESEGEALDGGYTGEDGLTGEDMALEGSGGDMGGDSMAGGGDMGGDMGAGGGGDIAINEGGTGDSIYTVQANETLMLIAFKLYGDYTRWREIAQLNAGKLGGGTNVSPGMQLSYSSAGAGFSWNPAGNPYLIKRGDSLSLISKDVYGTLFKWRKIWDNNKPLIKDPNKIFVGFTIYYLPDDSRDVASSPMADNSAGADNMGASEAPAVETTGAVDDFEDDFPDDI